MRKFVDKHRRTLVAVMAIILVAALVLPLVVPIAMYFFAS